MAETDDAGLKRGTSISMIGTVRLSADESGGSIEVIEYVGPATPPPHVHRERDEVFYVTAGAFHFIVGDSELDAPAGTLVHIARGTRHGFATTEGAKALLIIAPAGLQGFFEELGAGLAAGRSGEDLRRSLAGRYDSEPL